MPALSLPASSPSTQSPPAPAKAEQRATQAHAKLPLAFVPNRGQTDKSVRYYAQGAGHAFYFTPDKAVLSFTKKDKGVALHLTPLGASPSTQLVASERAPGKVNYLIGSEHHRNLPTYRELAYRNVWPGIDLVFRGQGGTLKYELHVQAGADLSKIGLAYGGADGLSVGKGGNLLIQTPLGTLRDSRPRSYQRIGGKRVPVDSRYAVKSGGNAYGFALGSSYDPRHPLVIDPGIEYSTFLGGSGSDRADGVAVDGAGSAYVTGRANSGFPTTAGAFDTSFNGGSERCLRHQAERRRLGARVLDLPRRRDGRRLGLARSRSTERAAPTSPAAPVRRTFPPRRARTTRPTTAAAARTRS